VKKHNPFSLLNRFEWGLWSASVVAVIICFMFVPEKEFLSLFASLVGVTALVFLAKGHILGQFLIILFSFLYGVISYCFSYYGEMMTYLGMSMPMAVLSIWSWLRHTDDDTHEVKIASVSKRSIFVLSFFSVVITVVFFFILKYLGTQSLLFSTISVTTSFVAASLTFLRSPFYALGYTLNDLVLIVLWVLASIRDLSYIPMIVCFAVFLVNDLYGFISWRKRMKRQNGERE